MTPEQLALAELGRARRQALAMIDTVAGEARQRYITDVPGQQAVYMTKQLEAEAYLAALAGNAATAEPGPHLAAEAQALGTTAQAVAENVISLASAWLQVLSPAIEGHRLAGKAAVNAAVDVDGIVAARDAALAALRAV